MTAAVVYAFNHLAHESDIEAGNRGQSEETSREERAWGAHVSAHEALTGERLWVNPTGGQFRGWGPHGSGGYLAPRRNPDGTTRAHNSLDISSQPGQGVVAPTSGQISRINYAIYDPDTGAGLSYVQISTDQGHMVRTLYVDPASGLEVGQNISAGQYMGSAEDLHSHYSSTMPQHVHVDINIGDVNMNPVWYLQ